MKISNAKKLLSDIAKALNDGQEYRTRTIRGVRNLSVSDLQTLKLYAETILKYGSYHPYLIKPLGGVAEVMAKYNLLE